MLGHRALSVDDYFTILKKRWWIVIVPAIIFAIVGVGLTFFVQPEYISQTLVLIEQQKVPDNYVKPIVSEDLNARLASMQEQILSRSRLQPIIERFNLYGTSGMGMDGRIDKVRKDIQIKPIESQIARTGGLPGFFISFKAGDAHTAQQVCGEITSLFISENLHAREQSAQGTTEFLKQQLSDAKRNLDEQDSKLAAFQRTYAGRLPGEETTNMTMLTSLNTQLEAATQALARMESDKTYGETMLASQTRDLPASDQQKVQPQTQQAELTQLIAQEADLTSRYTEDYPDVVSTRRKIRELRAQMAKAPAPSSSPAPVSSAPKGPEPANIVSMRAQLHSLDMGIAQKKRDQMNIQSQLRQYQDRISSSPTVQAEYKQLTRDYQTAQGFYDDLLQKMNQSKMATDLERRQQGEQFKLMDEPNLPEGPSFPKRGAFLGGGLGAGMMLGLLIVAWIEYRDTAIRSERDLWAFTKLPTLGMISLTADAAPQETKSRFNLRGRRNKAIPANTPLMNAGR
ncbi:Wzz/FepE/Etk N-terminal domain-containing protein [Granulicella sp. dw_53]|uniref:GumC family protein n=1 Tax=Granulicella sp. dw_53 TaxID=2719792 RepID=UPI001BD4877E|nr:Wzz/FepE/Etk N-terminal domain-containing protein [Granulicella sp. dw_53]